MKKFPTSQTLSHYDCNVVNQCQMSYHVEQESSFLFSPEIPDLDYFV